jgi:TonB dependent receptor
VELTLEKTWADNWYGQFSYTWSHNYGNAEGLVDSDIGQDDTGTTEAFDAPELMVGAYGNLPNDRRNVFKALGAYKFASDQLTISSALTVSDGRPKICLGADTIGHDPVGYGAAYYECGGVITPRGSPGTTPWFVSFDLGMIYEPSFAPGLTIQAKVYNLFDSHKSVNSYPNSQFSGASPETSPLDAGYGATQTYQQPRYVLLGAIYHFDFGK